MILSFLSLIRKDLCKINGSCIIVMCLLKNKKHLPINRMNW
jgi:hypothetical protein